MLLDYARNQELVNAAKAGKGEFSISTHWADSQYRKPPTRMTGSNRSGNGPVRQTHPLSAASKSCVSRTTSLPGDRTDDAASGETFISNHADAMNICEHPSVSSSTT
jgi:hypothetical protein